jgi:hypothetical protein
MKRAFALLAALAATAALVVPVAAASTALSGNSAVCPER